MGYNDGELGCKRWSVIIEIRKHDGRVEAKAHLFWPGRRLVGAGSVPIACDDDTLAHSADELASAGALSDLADQLLAQAALNEAAEQPGVVRQ